MPWLTQNQSATSPSFLQSVLAGSVEAELSDLHVKVKELEKNIQLLTVEVHEDITGRYINFDKFENSDSNYLQIALKYIQDLEHISSRIAEAQVKTVVEDSAHELLNLQDALNKSKTTLSVIHQLLNVDSALQSVKKSSTYLEAAAFYSEIPPMLQEISHNSVYQDLFEGLKKECTIQRTHLSFHLETLWRKTLCWRQSGQCRDDKPKLVNLMVFKDPKMDAIEILTALYYVNTVESTLYSFGVVLQKLVLNPILTGLTAVAVKDCQEHIALSLENSVSEESPPLPMVAANLKVVFDFLNEQLNVNLGSIGTTLSILGASISYQFSRTLLKNCLNTPSENGTQEDDFSQGLEELNELVEYISDSGFLHCNTLTKTVTKLMKSSANNPAFWECAAFLKKARLIMKKSINETLLLQEDSECQLLIGNTEDVKSLEDFDRRSAFAFPSCRVSKWIVELVDLFREVLKPRSGDEYSDRCLQFSKTARRIVEMYAAYSPVRCRDVGSSHPTEIILFHNNSLFLAHHLIQLKFDEIEKHSNGHKLISVDLIQRIRAIAVKSLLDCLKKQRNSIVEKTKEIDLANLKISCAELEKTVKECLLQLEYLHSAWNGVLPNHSYKKAMGGILNSWLEELIKILNSAENIPGNTARDLKVVCKVVANRVPILLEAPNDIASHVPRWSKFEALINTRFSIR